MKATKDGAAIVLKAIEALSKIAENAGVDGGVIINKVLDANIPNYGYDALKGEYGDMVAKRASLTRPKLPARRCKTRSQRGASFTEAVVAEIPEKDASRSPEAAEWTEWLIKTKQGQKNSVPFYMLIMPN